MATSSPAATSPGTIQNQRVLRGAPRPLAVGTCARGTGERTQPDFFTSPGIAFSRCSGSIVPPSKNFLGKFGTTAILTK